jgi:8-hydroxy-5-deazaflavin:NADPH oxidoreductase
MGRPDLIQSGVNIMTAENLQTIGIVSGTGREGTALAVRLVQAGYPVMIGSRTEERGLQKARELAGLLRSAGLDPTLSGGTNEEMIEKTQVCLLSVPFPHVIESVRSLGFRPGTILVDTTVPVAFDGGSPRLVDTGGRSVSEQIQELLPPEVHLATAFKTIPAKILGDLDSTLDCDLFVCSDSSEAKEVTMQIARSIPELRPVDAGPLAEARTIERMAVLAIAINVRYRVKSARFRVVGL